MTDQLPTVKGRWIEALRESFDHLAEAIADEPDEEDATMLLADHEWPHIVLAEVALNGLIGGNCTCSADHGEISIIDLGEDGETYMVLDAPTAKAARHAVEQHLQAYECGIDVADLSVTERDVAFISTPWQPESEWQVYEVTTDPAAGSIHVWWVS